MGAAAATALAAGAGAPGGSQSTLEPESDAARAIADLWWVMLIVSTVVVAVVVLLVLLAILRRRGAPAGSRVDRFARRLGGERLVAIAGLAIPICVLAAVFVLVLSTIDETAPATGEDSGLRVEVTGRQWFWEIAYPESGAVTANEVHIPVGEPVQLEVTSADVIHSFWVPELNRKIDMIPGRVNELTLEADSPGTYRGQCAEFCGLQHANMALLVVAEPASEFEAWLEHQADSAEPPATESAQAGAQTFVEAGCGGCHTIRGTQADGTAGPDLTHLAGRETLAAATLRNDRGFLGGWILDPQHVKPGAKMPATDLAGPELQDLLDYLEGLR